MLDEIANVQADQPKEGNVLMQRGDAQPLMSVDKTMFRLKAGQILEFHPLFKNLDVGTLRILLDNSSVLRANDKQVLYR